MPANAYQTWLGGETAGVTMAEAGAQLFQRLGCVACHKFNDTGRGPSLVGLLGSTVKLRDRSEIVADETYVRESILHPQAKIVAGYEPVMPTFKGLISEEGLLQLLAYLKTLSQQEGAQAKP